MLDKKDIEAIRKVYIEEFKECGERKKELDEYDDKYDDLYKRLHDEGVRIYNESKGYAEDQKISKRSRHNREEFAKNHVSESEEWKDFQENYDWSDLDWAYCDLTTDLTRDMTEYICGIVQNSEEFYALMHELSEHFKNFLLSSNLFIKNEPKFDSFEDAIRYTYKEIQKNSAYAWYLYDCWDENIISDTLESVDELNEQYTKNIFPDDWLQEVSDGGYNIDYLLGDLNYFSENELDFSGVNVYGLPFDCVQYQMPDEYLDKEVQSNNLMKIVEANPWVCEYLDKTQAVEDLLNNISKKIPTNYARLYPDARKIRRQVVIHTGPTNSGKTYESLQALRKVEKGAYLAPLRLLAYEVYEQFKSEGIPVALLTGEEEIPNPDAKITCSTCEMANLNEVYDLVVIDEAQMLSDPFRGSAWSKAIMGIQAYEMHICCAPEAVDLICKMLDDCKDEYVIEDHERKTPLVKDERSKSVVKKVQKGDCYIVFSRKKVHSYARELKNQGYKVSIIYGALPYTVRQNEAEKFRNGVTDVLVATDAIGMGMNLPIQRVIFKEDSKFDGKRVRGLTVGEYKQIAGRAGRYGLYDTGYFVHGDAKAILEEDVPKIKNAVVGIPPVLKYSDASVSEILKYWNDTLMIKGYEKEDVSDQIKRAQYLEALTGDKSLIWKLTELIFDDKDDDIYELWKKLSENIIEDKSLTFKSNKFLKGTTLKELEAEFKVLDLYYQFFKNFGYDDYVEEVMVLKEAISYKMIEILNDPENLEYRKCKVCGKIMPWNTQYSMCEDCYHAIRQAQYEEAYGW